MGTHASLQHKLHRHQRSALPSVFSGRHASGMPVGTTMRRGSWNLGGRRESAFQTSVAVVVLCAKAGDEFVTDLDVSELRPEEPGLDEREDDNDDDDFDDVSGWSTEWGARGADAGGPLAGQLSQALEGASTGQAVPHDGAGAEGA